MQNEECRMQNGRGKGFIHRFHRLAQIKSKDGNDSAKKLSFGGD
jgi:hypothetical protein